MALFAQKPITNITPFGEDLVEDADREDLFHYSFSISGTLFDRDTDEPILFANVAIYDTDSKLVTGTETDIDGRYHFSNLRPGLYNIEASYVGYITQRIGHVLLDGTDISKLDIFISEGGSIICCGCIYVEYKVPLINMANPSYITTFTSSDIANRY